MKKVDYYVKKLGKPQQTARLLSLFLFIILCCPASGKFITQIPLRGSDGKISRNHQKTIPLGGCLSGQVTKFDSDFLHEYPLRGIVWEKHAVRSFAAPKRIPLRGYLPEKRLTYSSVFFAEHPLRGVVTETHSLSIFSFIQPSMQVTIKPNTRKSGIEFHFTGEPNDREYAHLKKLGLNHRKDNSKIWFTLVHPAYQNYAETLEKELLENGDLFSVKIFPSYIPSPENITQDNFSYVTITYRKEEKEQFANYVIFDSIAAIAKTVAAEFGKKTFGKNYIRVNVLAKKQKRKSRELLIEGKVITGKENFKANILPTAPKLASQKSKGKEVKQKEQSAPEKMETGLEKIQNSSNESNLASLEPTLWNEKTDSQGRIGKIEIGGREYHQYRLRYALLDELERRATNEQKTIVRNLAALLDITYSLEGEYEAADQKTQDLVEVDRIKSIVDDAMLENDIHEPTKPIVMPWLIDVLFKKSGPKMSNPKLDRILKYFKEEGVYTFANQYDPNIFKLKEHLKKEGVETEEMSVSSMAILVYDIKLWEGNGKVVKRRKIETKTTQKPSSKHEETLKNTEFSKNLTQPYTIQTKDKTIPHVLVPTEIEEPFLSGALYIKEAQTYQEKFPHLWKYNNKSVKAAPAKDLFCLSQMAHPKDYGIAVNRSTLHEIWTAKGEALFEEIGFLVDSQYPFVNIHTGYYSIYELNYLLEGSNKAAMKWWSAIEHTRPIANLPEALKHINKLIAQHEEEHTEITNPQTGRPFGKFIEQKRKITWKLEQLKGGKRIIQSYINQKEASPQPSKEIQAVALKKVIDIPEKDYRLFYIEFTQKNRHKIGETKNLTEFKTWLNITYPDLNQTSQKGLEDFYASHIQSLAKGKKRIQRLSQPKKPQPYSAIFNKLVQVVPDLEASLKKGIQYGKSSFGENSGMMDLNLDVLGMDKENRYIIALSHYYSQNGDLVADPDMQVRIDFEQKTAEALTYQDTYGYIEVYPEKKGKTFVNTKAKKAQNKFLSQWLTNLINQDHKIIWSAKSTEQAQPVDSGPTDTHPEYLDRVIAHLHEKYAEGKRPTKGQIEKLQAELAIPNKGVLWEAVELSWLLWYKQLYYQKLPFEVRLSQMIHFWNKLQPTYAYSDSSKELFKQYSTSCPISAIVAQYTKMDAAQHIFEPSAGNGLLVLGADPKRTHVNEIDPTRLVSLRFQQFSQITQVNAIEPFPEEWTKKYDVVVTNPPFAKWEENKLDKQYLIRKYFGNQIGLAKYIRLEHYMAGLALHTLKDQGRAAIIIMGHVYFGPDGLIARYRPFFNWLYRHYHVDDIINMNSFKLYNKQGAIEKTMLILIHGRKAKPIGVAPNKAQSPELEDMVESFEALWERVNTHLKFSLQTLINQLKTLL